jgi:hypothetical protein
LDEAHDALNLVAVFAFSLLAVATLLFAGAAVPRGIVPWPRMALELDRNRTDLTVVGFAAVAIAFALVFVKEFGL